MEYPSPSCLTLRFYWLDVAQEAFLTTELAKNLSRFEVIVLSPEPGDEYGEFLAKVRAGMVTNTMIDEINRRCYDPSAEPKHFEVQLVDDNCNQKWVMQRRRRGKTIRQFKAVITGKPPQSVKLPTPRTLRLALGELVYYERQPGGPWEPYAVGWVQSMTDALIAI